MIRPAIFEREPTLEGRLPHVPLGVFPTPVERVMGLVPPSVELWVKREDLASPVYGGNKVRKLEHLLAAARTAGATRLLTLGGDGSNHVLATAIHGAGLGLQVEALTVPQPVTPQLVDNLRRGAAVGCQYLPVGSYPGVVRGLPRLLRRDTAFIPAGGSSALGSVGYVSAGLELASQVAEGVLPPVDVIYLALGSGGTTAGLLVGLHLGLHPGPHRRMDAKRGSVPRVPRVVGVRVVHRIFAVEQRALRLARATARCLRSHGAQDPALADFLRGRFRAEDRLSVDHRHAGRAYGSPTTAAIEAVQRASEVGLHLETTYTGKAMAALLEDARAGLLDGKRVLFVQTWAGPSRSTPKARPEPLPGRLGRLDRLDRFRQGEAQRIAGRPTGPTSPG